jgi:hypothetical protein
MVTASVAVTPLRLIVGAGVEALSLMRIWAKREPAADGVNATLSVQPVFWV